MFLNQFRNILDSRLILICFKQYFSAFLNKHDNISSTTEISIFCRKLKERINTNVGVDKIINRSDFQREHRTAEEIWPPKSCLFFVLWLCSHRSGVCLYPCKMVRCYFMYFFSFVSLNLRYWLLVDSMSLIRDWHVTFFCIWTKVFKERSACSWVEQNVFLW